MREESDRPASNGGGWMHPRSTAETHAPRHQKAATTRDKQAIDWQAEARRYAAQITDEQVQQLAEDLDVNSVALRDLGIGFGTVHVEPSQGAAFDVESFVFPMFGADGTITGLRQRTPTSHKKFAVTGSRLGILRRLRPDDGPLLICEGESDTAAALSYGFNAIGRPGVTTCAEIAAAYARDQDAVVVADNDGENLAVNAGLDRLRQELIATARSVRVIYPPAGIKDLREWRQQGATLEDIQDAIDAAPHQDADSTAARTFAMPTVSAEDLAADTSAQEWLIKGWLYRHSLALLAGQSAAGKSFLLTDICLRMRHGLDFHGFPMISGSSLYFAGEGFGGIRKRIRAWLSQNSVLTDPSHYFHFVDGVPPLATDEGRLTLYDTVASLADKHGHAPEFVVIDTMSQAFGAADENDSKSVAPALKNAEMLKAEFGCTVCCVHHIAKHVPPSNLTMDSIRGSGAFHGNVDAAWGLARTKSLRTLKPLKNRDGADEDIELRFDLLSVETGTTMESGEPERSCVIHPIGTSAQTSTPDLDEFLAEQIRTSKYEGLSAPEAYNAAQEAGIPAGRTVQV